MKTDSLHFILFIFIKKEKKNEKKKHDSIDPFFTVSVFTGSKSQRWCLAAGVMDPAGRWEWLRQWRWQRSNSRCWDPGCHNNRSWYRWRVWWRARGSSCTCSFNPDLNAGNIPVDSLSPLNSIKHSICYGSWWQSQSLTLWKAHSNPSGCHMADDQLKPDLRDLFTITPKEPWRKGPLIPLKSIIHWLQKRFRLAAPLEMTFTTTAPLWAASLILIHPLDCLGISVIVVIAIVLLCWNVKSINVAPKKKSYDTPVNPSPTAFFVEPLHRTLLRLLNRCFSQPCRNHSYNTVSVLRLLQSYFKYDCHGHF